MNLRLTHYGWMVTHHLSNSGQLHLGNSPQGDLLLELWTGPALPATDFPFHTEILDEGMIELVDESLSKVETRLRYNRNPFEHINKIIFEFTTYCNFSCAHCYNGHVSRHTETRLDLLWYQPIQMSV